MIGWADKFWAAGLAIALGLALAGAARAQSTDPQVTLVLGETSIVEGNSTTVHATLDKASTAATSIVLASSSSNLQFLPVNQNTLTIAAGATTSNSLQIRAHTSSIVGEATYTATISGTATNTAGIQQPASLGLTVADNGAKLGITPPPSSTAAEDVGTVSFTFSFATPFSANFNITPSVTHIAASGATAADVGTLVSNPVTFPARPGDFTVSFDMVVADNHEAQGDKAFLISFTYSSTDAAMRAALPEPPAPITLTIADDETGGSPAWQATDDDSHGILGVLQEGSAYSLAISTAGATLTNTAKIPAHLRNIARSYQVWDTGNRAWREIAHHAADADGMDMPYTPGESDGGSTVRVCVFFEDTDGDHQGGPAAAMGAAFADLTQAQRLAGQLCSAGILVQNTNQPPQGAPYLAHVSPSGGAGLTIESTTPPTALLETWHVMAVLSTNGTVTGDSSDIGPVTDADGGLVNIGGGQWQYSLQRATDAAGPWSELRYSTDNGAVGRVVSQQLTQEDADMGWMRVCTFYIDGQGTPEGGPRATAAQRVAGTLCSTAYEVGNVSTRPVAVNSTVHVSVDATQTAPYNFKAGDFMYTDAPDNDGLKGITLFAVPATGTLQLDGADATVGTFVPLASIPNLAYWPASGQSATSGYATLGFTVQDDGTDSTNSVTASGTNSQNNGTITIDLTPSAQAAAGGAPTVTPAAVSGRWDEDTQLTASTTGITDSNGIDAATLMWQWQSAPAPVDSAYTDIAGANAATFTPLQTHLDSGVYIRVCASFMDGHATPASEERCSTAARVRAVNDAPTGGPAIALSKTATQAVTSATEGIALQGQYLPAHPLGDLEDEDGLVSGGDNYLESWQTSTAASGAAWTERGNSMDDNDYMYTPSQVDVDDGFLRMCVFYVDAGAHANGGASNSKAGREAGTICSAVLPVVNVNNPASGAPVLIYSSSPSVSNLGGTAQSPVTSVPEGIRLGIFRVIKTSEGGVVDADGFPAGQQVFLSYQAGSAAGGWSEFGYDDITRNLPSIFFDDSHLALGFMRICMFYTDNGGEVEGGPRTTAAQREQGTICSTPVPITDVSSKPVAEDAHIAVPATASSSSPYTFSAADFRSTDPDAVDDTVTSVQIASLPMAGTLQVGGSDATVGQSVNIANIGTITYWPASGQSATAGYASFTFQVTDDGGTPSPIAASTTLVADAIGTQSAAATITIDLTSATQTAASGAPTVAASDSMATAHDEDVELTASTSGITEPNGIDHSTLRWQWQQAASQNGNYEDLASGTTSIFTPGQAQAGLWLRVCASFSDAHSTPVSETLCSTGQRIAQVDDAPTSADAFVNVFTTNNVADPFLFAPGHFPYTDEEGAALASVTIVSLPGAGTLRTGQFVARAGDLVAAADIASLSWYPVAGAGVQQGYASFQFSVSDGANASDIHRMRINIVPPGPLAASGAPSLAPDGATFAEDAPITASTRGVSDPNGIDQTTVTWQWQAAAEARPGVAPDAADYANISGATMATFTPDQPQVGMYIRVCVSFRDLYADPDTGVADPRAEGPLCSAAGRVTNSDDLPTGAPRLVILGTDDDISDPSPVRASEGQRLGVVTDDMADQDGGLPAAGGDYDLIWQVASNRAFTSDFSGRARTDIAVWGDVGNGDIYLTQVDADAGFIRACISYVDSVTLVRTGGDFRDMQGRAAASICSAALPVRNVNDPITGLPALTLPHRENTPILSNLNAVMDEDGFSSQITDHDWQWWQADPDEANPMMPGTFSIIEGATAFTFTPGYAQADKFLRACVTITDNHGTIEGPLCATTPDAVVNRNNAPVARDVRVSVLNTASSTAPYTFTVADFPFDDLDPDDSLASVEITTLPTAGTLQVNGTDATALQSVTAANIADEHIKYWPAASQDVQTGYATFTFKVTDDGSQPVNTRVTSTAAATITIDLTNPTQVAASGTPTVAASDSMATAHNEDVELTASTSGITEPNGIDRNTLQWRWQSSADAVGPYTDIPGATAATFTPLQEHVGLWVQVCVEFDDLHSTAVNEGPFCSSTAQIANVNDAPTSADAFVDVFTTATQADPFVFTAAHFPFMDEDVGSAMASITLVTAPATGRGRMTFEGSLIADGTTVGLDDFANLQYFLLDNTREAERGFTSFTFTVNDGAADSATYTMRINLVAPGPTAARGAPLVTTAAGGVVYNEDVALAAATGTIIDPNGIDQATLMWQWQSAPAPASGRPQDSAYTDIAGANAATFTPLQAQVGRLVRVCLSFMDRHIDVQTGEADPREEGPLCSDPGRIINVNDAPTSADASVDVFITADADAPFFFNAGHFAFTDEDVGDNASLDSVTITATATTGTLRTGTGADAVVFADGTSIRADDIGTLNFYPDAEQEAMAAYSSFMFSVYDGAAHSATHRMTINLVPPGPVAATGMPSVAASDAAQTAFDEDVELAASTTGITEPNGINASTVQWQWQQGAAEAGPFAPIAGADEVAFTPLQAQVGQWIRVCASFMDEHVDAETGEADPREEGPLCSAPAQVANVNDAPTSADSQINVFTIADADNPYHLTAADFPFADEDVGDNSTLSSIRVVDTISAGNLLLGVNDVRDGTLITAAELAELRFWPDADTEATPAYTTFSFRLSDGLAETAEHIMTINIVPPGQLDASGEPAITGTPEQNATLTAGRGTVRDPNGIDDDSIAWQWSMAATTSGTFTAIPGASGPDADEFIPTQTQVDRYLQLCMTFMDEFVDLATNSPQPGQESRCSAPFGPIANVNDAPQATDHHHQAARTAGSDAVQLPASVFIAAWSDPDPEDRPQSITITALPDESHGTLTQGNAEVAAGQPLALADGAFSAGPLTFTIAEGVQDSSLRFTISDGTLSSNQATLTLSFGRDIEQKQVQQVSAILSAAAITNATGAISAALSAAPAAPAAAPAFDLQAAGTSLTALGRSLQRNLGPADPAATARAAITQDNTALPPTMATAAQRAWYLGTTGHWQQLAAANAADHSADAILARISALANGDLALQYSMADLADMRIWARFQSLEFSGNPLQRDGTDLVYDGSGTGFYLGADTRITDGIRAGLAIGTDSSDLSLDLDNDDNDDAASRSATSFYPYLHINLGSGNQARIIAGTGSGDLTIKSSANNNQSATTDLSWSMLAASASHDRPIEGPIHLRASASLQTGSSSTDAATFAAGSTLMAGDSSSSELAFATEFSYHRPGIVPHATLTARKWFGDLKQGMAYDLGLGADINTGPATLRLAMTRQINATTHKRHSISINAATTPNALGITASLGASHDSTGRPQWQSTIGWQRRNFQTSLQASPGDYRLQARLRW